MGLKRALFKTNMVEEKNKKYGEQQPYLGVQEKPLPDIPPQPAGDFRTAEFENAWRTDKRV